MDTGLRDPQGYLERMAKPLQEKLKIVHFIQESSKEILDVGVADGTVTIAMANLFPDKNFFGIDLSEEFINIAKKNSIHTENVQFEKVYLRDLLPRNTRYDVITFCSVLHEFFTYGEGISSVLKALSDSHELLKVNGRVIIRDMVLHNYTKVSDLFVNRIIEKISRTSYSNNLEEFEKVFGKVNNIYLLNHFLLKYIYSENWDRELKENYTPVTFEEYENIFSLLGMKILFKRSYLIDYLRNKWQEDFNLNEEEIQPFRSTGILVAEKV